MSEVFAALPQQDKAKNNYEHLIQMKTGATQGWRNLIHSERMTFESVESGCVNLGEFLFLLARMDEILLSDPINQLTFHICVKLQ
ncbi:hypothetical protein AGR4A_pTi0148 [Agrobacterium tumefaciens str. B6]|uniref:Uncharacterized protein n=1 Tax=Agrobacterium tumefaciens str. B6 TaxID=1183423 RepID=A0A822VCM3_AGRTU|nr:hypothetical protein X971_5316 [Agrobacterium tumefaciens LBA4213 (Ach5)]CUX06806.1 hypothetical protein AGR1C_pTi0157 [Agrobacterium fabacearum TT111]CVI25550.1 hypothetical protein AGR4A_pTi0148 [Agrobacterium tumefaciens str. B6]